jgi:hypothetical protein
MGLKSSNKGETGEREIAALMAELTGFDVRRKVRQHHGDSDLEGIPGWSVKVKRHAKATRATVRAWWDQTVTQSQSYGAIPVLLYRQDRDEWRAVWPVAVLLTMQHTAMWSGCEWTTEGSMEAWCAVLRDVENAVARSAPGGDLQ